MSLDRARALLCWARWVKNGWDKPTDAISSEFSFTSDEERLVLEIHEDELDLMSPEDLAARLPLAPGEVYVLRYSPDVIEAIVTSPSAAKTWVEQMKAKGLDNASATKYTLNDMSEANT